MSRVRTINKEIVTALCNSCKCCLAGKEHCYICHSKRAIETLCGCGDCPAKVEDLIQRLRVSANKRAELARIRGMQNAA